MGEGRGASAKPRVVTLVLGPAVAVVALGLIFAKVPLAAAIATMRQADLGWVSGALAAAFAVQVVDAVRVRRLLDAHGLRLTLPGVLRLALATQFYGFALPGGSVSGVVARCAQLSTTARRLGAGACLLADQLLVTVAMCVVGGACWFADHRARGEVAAGVWLVAALLLATARVAPPVAPARWLRRRLGERGRTLRDAVRPMIRMPHSTFIAVASLALVSNVLRVGVYSLLARAFGVEVPWVTMGWIRSGMMLATLPPVSVAGLGLREGASLLLLGGRGVSAPQIVAFSLSIFAMTALWALVGGVVELRRTARWLRIAPLKASAHPSGR